MIRTAIALCLILCAATAADPSSAAAAARAEVASLTAAKDKAAADYDAKIVAAGKRWLASINTTPLPVPSVGQDPRESEKVEREEVGRINDALARIASIKKDRGDDAATIRRLLDDESIGRCLSAADKRRAGK